jgi:hypothetical protein
MKVAFAALLFSACTLTNSIDVCQREAPAQVALGINAAGTPEADGDSALGAMPDGQSMLVYTASPHGPERRGVEARIAGVFVDGDGRSRPTCNASSQSDTTYREGLGMRMEPTLAAPLSNGLGLVAWAEANPETPDFASIWAVPIDMRGCPRIEPFLISTAMDRWVNVPTIARLSDRQFLVAWLDMPYRGGPARILARVVQLGTVSFEFLSTRLDARAQPAPVTRTSNMVVAVTVKPLGGSQFALLWAEISTYEGAIKSIILDSLLSGPTAPITLDRFIATDGLNILGLDVDLSVGPTHVLALWSRLLKGDKRRIAGRSMALTALPEAWSSAFLLRESSIDGDDWNMTSTALGDDSFLVTWACVNCPASGAAVGSSIHSVALATDGTRVFTSWQCDVGDFSISRGPAGSQAFPATVLTTRKRVNTIWTGAGTSSDIQGVQYPVEEMLPTP